MKKETKNQNELNGRENKQKKKQQNNKVPVGELVKQNRQKVSNPPKPKIKQNINNEPKKNVDNKIVKQDVKKTVLEEKALTKKTPKAKKEKVVQPLLDKNDIKIFSLGGLGVVGMNMYCVEYQNELIIMDAGILFADDDDHGVNYIIPDFTYLMQNEHKIIGLFITHGHEDHIGAIPFLLQKVKIKNIYASGIAVGLINNKMVEWPNVKYHIEEYNTNSVLSFKNFEVSFFRTNHSIPDSYGIAIKTPLGYVVNTGDFKFDFSPIGPISDYYKMTRLGEAGVLCLLSESTNAQITSFSSSERKIGENLNNLFKQIDGRIIVATFASNVYRVQQIISSSIESNRKVIVFGHSMEKTIEVATRLKYINAPKGWIVRSRDIKRIENERVTILCTGSQGEPLAALSRIANGTHKQIKLYPNDTIIYSSKPIPGNEQFINRNINKLVHAGAHVIKNSPLTDTHTTGHASENELRMMLAFMRPKYFVPIHGEYAMLTKHVELAQNQGTKKENCFILGCGDVLSINKKGAKALKHVIPASDIYLDSSLSDVDNVVLKERKLMADGGLISVTYFVNKKREIIGKPIIKSSGFATPDAKASLTEPILNKSIDIYKGLLQNNSFLKNAAFEKQVQNQLGQYLFHKMDRHPLIVVTIKEI